MSCHLDGEISGFAFSIAWRSARFMFICGGTMTAGVAGDHSFGRYLLLLAGVVTGGWVVHLIAGHTW